MPLSRHRKAQYGLAALTLLLSVLCLPASAAISLDIDGEGAEGLERNLEAHLTLANEPCDAPDWRIRALFARSEQEMSMALRALGHYQPAIETTLSFEENCWQFNARVSPGPRVTIRSRTIEVAGEMAEDPAYLELLGNLPLAEGAFLHHGLYESIKSRLQNLAAERGYFDFSLTEKQLCVDTAQSSADIRIRASSGRRYQLGEIRFTDVALDSGFLHRLADLQSDTPFNARALISSSRYLSDAGYFSDVEVRPAMDERADQKVPIDIRLTQAEKHAWRTGVGFATDTGPRGSVRYDNRQVNAAGHHWESELRVSAVESGLTGDYQVPGFNPHRDNYSFAFGFLREDTESFDSDSAKVILRHAVAGEVWTQTRFLELLHENSTIGASAISSTLVMPGVGLNRIVADDILRTRKGYRVNFELRGAHDSFISDATFLQFRANAKGIYRFGEGGRVVARAEVGTTVGDGVSRLPASIRFFAGGDNSIRGYNLDALGPTDDDGSVIGGRHLVAVGMDYEHPVVDDDWWVAAFVDAGNAFDDSLDVKLGYGVGVRWYSPIGRIRVDFAIPEDDSDSAWQLHIGLGVDL